MLIRPVSIISSTSNRFYVKCGAKENERFACKHLAQRNSSYVEKYLAFLLASYASLTYPNICVFEESSTVEVGLLPRLYNRDKIEHEEAVATSFLSIVAARSTANMMLCGRNAYL